MARPFTTPDTQFVDWTNSAIRAELDAVQDTRRAALRRFDKGITSLAERDEHFNRLDDFECELLRELFRRAD